MQSKYVYFAFGVGITLGAAVALLFAPQSGEATRKKIGEGFDGAGDYLEDTAAYLKQQAEKLASEADALVKQAKDSVDTALEQAGDFVVDTLKSSQLV